MILLLLLGSRVGPASTAVEAHITVDLTRGEGIAVTQRWTGTGGTTVFRALGGPGEYTFDEVAFTDATGPLPHTTRLPDWTVTGGTGPITMSYVVTPGGEGRHGVQGARQADWAVFDGRMFPIPTGGRAPSRIAVDFVLPEGWRVAAPWPVEDGRHVITPSGAASADRLLLTGCVGLGAFDVREPAEGLRVASYSGWADEHRDALASRTAAMVSHFREAYGFQPADIGPYTVVWTPRVGDQRVFGGSGATGVCFENPPDLEVARTWQLLAHRLGHGVNRYSPTGLHLRDLRDRWFQEGWAGWVEGRATERVGFGVSPKLWTGLYRRYRRRRAERGAPVVLADEPRAGPDQVEYLHYTVAPLVVVQLEHWVRDRSGRDLGDFARHLTDKHGRLRGAVSLREELAAWSGHRFDDFWALFVDQEAPIPPVWDGVVTDAVREAAGRDGVVVAAGMPVSEDLLRHLALHGELETYAALKDWVLDAHVRLADLHRRGVKLVPDAVWTHRHGLPGDQHADLLEAAMRYPMHLAPELPSRGCSGPTPLPDRTWVSNPNHPVAALFDALLESEVGYADQLGRAGVHRLTIREGKEGARDQLAFSDTADLALFTRWVSAPPVATYKAVQDDRTAAEKQLAVEPGWRRSWALFPRGSREPGSGIVTFRVEDSEGLLIERSFWQFAADPGAAQLPSGTRR